MASVRERTTNLRYLEDNTTTGLTGKKTQNPRFLELDKSEKIWRHTGRARADGAGQEIDGENQLLLTWHFSN